MFIEMRKILRGVSLGWERIVGAQVGIFKFEMSTRLANGNAMFEVGRRSLRSGLKITWLDIISI